MRRRKWFSSTVSRHVSCFSPGRRKTASPNNHQTCLFEDLRSHCFGKQNDCVIEASIVDDGNEYLWPLFEYLRIEPEGQSDKSQRQ
jgi:hypothetical protein